MIAKGTMFFQSLSNPRNSAIWHGEIKRKSFDLTMPNCGNSQIWEWLTKTKQCTLCRVKGKYNTKIQVFFLSRLLEWALMAPWNTRSLSQKQLSTHERGSSSYLLYAIWFIFTRSWWFDRLLCSLILLSIFSDQHTGAIWVEKNAKKSE